MGKVLFCAAVLVSLAACADSGTQVKVEQLQRDNDSLQRENMQLRSERDQLRNELTIRSKPEIRPVQNVRETPREARTVKVSGELKKAGVTLRDRGGRETSLVIGADDLFEKRSIKIDKEGAHRLDLVAKYIKENFPSAELRIEGHSDSDPVSKLKDKYPTNKELSAARAESVMDYLVKKSKLDSSRISVSGVGDAQPLDPKDKKKNRRVEIVIVQ